MSAIKTAVQGAVMSVMKTAIEHAPDSWMPGGRPDPMIERKHGLIGAPVSRLDGPLKVQGKARFAAEFPMDGMVYAALAYSTIAKGGILKLDTAAAEAAPGVVLVMTYRNAPKLNQTPLFGTDGKAAGGDNLTVMQDRRIHWNGQPIAVVLAETQEQADHAKSLITVTYHEDASVTSYAAAKARGTEPGLFQGEPLKLEIGDAEAALAAAPHRVDVTYTTPRYSHNAIELHAATLAWKGDELTIHDATQAVAHTAWSMAQIFGLKEDQVHVTSPYVGGGFGSKTMWSAPDPRGGGRRSWPAGRCASMLSREGVYRDRRRAHDHRAARGDGRPRRRPPDRADPHRHGADDRAQQHARAVRAAGPPRVRGRHDRCSTWRPPTMDVVAEHVHAGAGRVGRHVRPRVRHRRARDRARHGSDRAAHPERARRRIRRPGTPFSSRHIVEAWRAGAERFGWKDRNAVPGSRRDGEWLIGMGCATATYPYYRMPGGVARMILTKSMPVRRTASSVKVEIAAHEMGMGTSTAQTQVAAERLGLAMDGVQVCYGDSRFPRRRAGRRLAADGVDRQRR